jgi:hypothetical protein
MWRCVDAALADVLEERIASIFRVEKSASGEPASAGGCRRSHQSDTTSYIRKGREGVLATPDRYPAAYRHPSATCMLTFTQTLPLSSLLIFHVVYILSSASVV